MKHMNTTKEEIANLQLSPWLVTKNTRPRNGP